MTDKNEPVPSILKPVLDKMMRRAGDRINSVPASHLKKLQAFCEAEVLRLSYEWATVVDDAIGRALAAGEIRAFTRLSRALATLIQEKEKPS